MARAILHIGIEKTGTTSLQETLSHNRGILNQYSFHYSFAPGRTSHWVLALYAADRYLTVDLQNYLGLRDEAAIQKLLDQFEIDLRAELEEHPDKVFIFSNEHCHSRLNTQESVDKLYYLLNSYFKDIRVVVYLRRQDRLSVSFYSTLLQGGSTSLEQISAATSRLYFDFAALLKRWGNAFGLDHLIVALAEEQKLAGGSVVSDFTERFQIPQLTSPYLSRNRSLSLAGQDVLRELNISLRDVAEPVGGFVRSFVVQADAAIGTDRGRQPRAGLARAFAASFSGENEWVRENFFPDESALFDDDFSDYPNVEEPRQPEQMTAIASLALRIAGEVISEASARDMHQRAELGYYRGFVHHESGRFEAAVGLLRDALEIDPCYAMAWDMLARGRDTINTGDGRVIAGDTAGGGIQSITRDDVLWAYRMILGREPENEAVVATYTKLPDRRALREAFLRSTEFRTCLATIAKENGADLI